MPTVATDDAARRQEFIWLGPVNSPWPFEARGRSWVMAVLLCPALVILAFLLAPRPLIQAVIPGPLGLIVTGLAATVVGVGAGVLATSRLGRLISPTRPLPHHLAVLSMEIAAPRPARRTTHRLHTDRPLWLETRPEHRRIHAITGVRITEEDPR